VPMEVQAFLGQPNLKSISKRRGFTSDDVILQLLIQYQALTHSTRVGPVLHRRVQSIVLHPKAKLSSKQDSVCLIKVTF
jgi:hypothetical protein